MSIKFNPKDTIRVEPEMKMEGGKYSRVIHIIFLVILLLSSFVILVFGNLEIL